MQFDNIADVTFPKGNTDFAARIVSSSGREVGDQCREKTGVEQVEARRQDTGFRLQAADQNAFHLKLTEVEDRFRRRRVSVLNENPVSIEHAGILRICTPVDLREKRNLDFVVVLNRCNRRHEWKKFFDIVDKQRRGRKAGLHINDEERLLCHRTHHPKFRTDIPRKVNGSRYKSGKSSPVIPTHKMLNLARDRDPGTFSSNSPSSAGLAKAPGCVIPLQWDRKEHAANHDWLIPVAVEDQFATG